jgi:transcriptional regulator with PAS, ATPase and Fis domain
VSVLVTGESGTGKELVAKALHDLSGRRNKPFVAVNCAAIPETLIESEIFGHEKGAFTGAQERRAGCFELAEEGTLLLDEIGEMPAGTQAKLLRVLEDRKLRRLGSKAETVVDVRVIAATNRDMRALVAENLFREDLYYRLTMVELKLPRLADRKEDLPLLQHHFVGRFAHSYGKRIGGISRRAQAVLSRHAWPGNVRELENVLGHACMMADAEFIDVRDLPDYLQNASAAPEAADPELMPLADLERRYTQHVLERVGGNKLHAAQVLGISRATLYRILRDGAPQTGGALVDFLGRTANASRLRIQ